MSTVHTLESVERINGVADEFGFVVTGRGYDPASDYEWKYTTAFVTPWEGAEVSMILESGESVYIDRPWRFGDKLNSEWIQRFYSIN